jgi:hypothetical protein
MAQIDDFKAQLIGGGARANQFKDQHYQLLLFQKLQFHFVVGTFMLLVTVLLMKHGQQHF